MPTTSTSSSSPSSSGQADAHSLRHLGARKKFNLSEIGVGGAGGGVTGGAVTEGVAMGGASHMRISGSGSSISGGALVGGVSTPVKEREQSSLVSLVHACSFCTVLYKHNVQSCMQCVLYNYVVSTTG